MVKPHAPKLLGDKYFQVEIALDATIKSTGVVSSIARDWLESHQLEDHVQRNLAEFVKRYPPGQAPGVGGVQVIM